MAGSLDCYQEQLPKQAGNRPEHSRVWFPNTNTQTHYTSWEKILTEHTLKYQVSKIYKVLTEFHNKKEYKIFLSKNEISVKLTQSKHPAALRGKESLSSIIWKIQIKTVELSPHTCEDDSYQKYQTQVLTEAWR